MYLNSNQLEIFPVSKTRLTPFSSANILTEDNILNLIRSVAPSKSFVISDTYDASSTFEFVINGYYISIKGTSTNFSGKDVYAHIFIDTSSPQYPHIWGVDENGKFTGVTFSTSIDEPAPTILGKSYEKYSLHILTTNNEQKYIVPLTSYYCIDGGLIV